MTVDIGQKIDIPGFKVGFPLEARDVHRTEAQKIRL